MMIIMMTTIRVMTMTVLVVVMMIRGKLKKLKALLLYRVYLVCHLHQFYFKTRCAKSR